MRTAAAFLLVLMTSTAVWTQSPEPPLADTRLSVHTLVREDIFAGFLQGDLTRLARAEKNIEAMLASRPDARAPLLAWQGATALTRAAIAHDAKRSDEFQRQHRRAIDLFEEAMRLGPNDVGVFAITGGTQASVADRLPAAERAAGWQLAYTAYQRLWQMQGDAIDKLPLHHKGELLAGLAQSAQRTGRTGEVGQQLDRILAQAPDSIYARRAQEWKSNPASMAQAKLTCQTCHAPGTLAARIAEVSKAQR
jgi:tetratricopeptide (TPR) repeat protein